MPSVTTPSTPLKPALWGLWVLLATGTIGFAILITGLYAGQLVLVEVGIVVLAFCTLTFLFLQFWATLFGPARLATQATPVERMAASLGPRRVAGENFNHLLSHTLERVTPESQVPLVLFQPVPSLQATAEPTPQEKVAMVLTEAVPVDPGLLTEWPAPEPARAAPPINPATLERRNGFIRGLPLVKQILKEPAPPTLRPRPGKTLGQCSGCGTKLWAPAARPIRLRCPRCGKVALLE